MTILEQSNFAALDWAIVAGYLALTVVVGALLNRYVHSAAGYMVGGRASGTALNVATYVGTNLGLVTLMYAAIDAFANGFAYVTLALIGAAVGLFLGKTGFVIGRLRRLELLTLPEFFEQRFGRRTRILGGTICAIAGILNMGLFPRMGATFIAYSTGLGGAEDSEMLINIITSLLIVLVLVYTVLGGMVSVIVTDYVQFVVLSLGMALGVYFCLTHADLGWGTMTHAMAEHRGERMFNPVAENGYGWGWLIFNAVVFFAAGICWAPESSRALTSSSERVTLRTFLFAAPGQFIRLGVPALWAVAAFTLVSQSGELSAYFFPQGLDGEVNNPARAMPWALGTILPTGLLGLLVAGLMAAFMSTHDSYLLCWSSVISRDIVSPLKRNGLTDRQQILVARISVVGIGAFLLIWGVWYELPKSVWNYMAMTGTVYMSGAVTTLIAGLYWSRASSAGAVAALLGGLIALIGIFLPPLNEALGTALTVPMTGMATFMICPTLLVIFSLLMPDRPSRPGQTNLTGGATVNPSEEA